MKCPNCGTESGEGAKFCEECGAALTTEAAVENPDGASTAKVAPEKEDESVSKTDAPAAVTEAAAPTPPATSEASAATAEPNDKKRRNRVIAIVCAVAAALVVVAVVVIGLGNSLNGKWVDKRLGTEITIDGDKGSIYVPSNGSTDSYTVSISIDSDGTVSRDSGKELGTISRTDDGNLLFMLGGSPYYYVHMPSSQPISRFNGTWVSNSSKETAAFTISDGTGTLVLDDGVFTISVDQDGCVYSSDAGYVGWLEINDEGNLLYTLGDNEYVFYPA